MFVPEANIRGSEDGIVNINASSTKPKDAKTPILVSRGIGSGETLFFTWKGIVGICSFIRQLYSNLVSSRLFFLFRDGGCGTRR
mmetsp:Transcript_5441/g.8279  ORF Transcript_5441/g.8279 Transcript_5441/m.8279 type:complete len:84 (+) Transcript_5441:978-1229(+)